MRAGWGAVTGLGFVMLVACGETAVSPAPTADGGAPPDATAPVAAPAWGKTTLPLEGSASEHSVVRALAVGPTKDDVYVVFERQGQGAFALGLARFDPGTRAFGAMLTLSEPSAERSRALHAEVLPSGRVVVVFDHAGANDVEYRALVSDGSAITSRVVLATVSASTLVDIGIHVSPVADEGALLVTGAGRSGPASDRALLASIVGGAVKPPVAVPTSFSTRRTAFSAGGVGISCSADVSPISGRGKSGCQRLREGKLEPFVVDLDAAAGCPFDPVAIAWAPDGTGGAVSGRCDAARRIVFFDEAGQTTAIGVPEALSLTLAEDREALALSGPRTGALTVRGDTTSTVTFFDERGPRLTTTREERASEPVVGPVPTLLAADGRAYVVTGSEDRRGLGGVRLWDGTKLTELAFPTARQNGRAALRDWLGVLLPSGALFALDVQRPERGGLGAFDGFLATFGASAPAGVASRSLRDAEARPDGADDEDARSVAGASLLVSRRRDLVWATVPGAVEERRAAPLGWRSDRLWFAPGTSSPSFRAAGRAVLRIDPLTGEVARFDAPCPRLALLPASDRPILACETPGGGIGVVLPD